MNHKIIAENLTEMKTPVGVIKIECLTGIVHFDVIQGTFSSDYELCQQVEKEKITAEANCQIRVAKNNLRFGEKYNVSFQGGQFRFNAGDEHTISLTGIFGSYALGIGAYDPNDIEKIRQRWDNSTIPNARNFSNYMIDVLDNMTGYVFELIDNSDCEYIYFPVAWIKIGECENSIYESAVDFWIS